MEYINCAHCPQVQHSHDTIMTSCFKFHWTEFAQSFYHWHYDIVLVSRLCCSFPGWTVTVQNGRRS